MKVADIDPQRRAALDAGQAQSATLTEALAVDFAALLAACFPALPADLVAQVRAARGEGISRRMALVGQILLAQYGADGVAALTSHPSDTVRGWACFAVAGQDSLALADRLTAMRGLADDPHFGVREWAWLAVRPHIAADLDTTIALLAGWTPEPSAHLRRFASEATRPRGVWCPHLGPLKANPALGLPILAPLRADPDRYVQDSVGNWLNDAAKSKPDWVVDLCERWTADSPSPATHRICAKALRSLTPKKAAKSAKSR